MSSLEGRTSSYIASANLSLYVCCQTDSSHRLNLTDFQHGFLMSETEALRGELVGRWLEKLQRRLQRTCMSTCSTTRKSTKTCENP